jgi:hypothetical protein
MTPPLIPLRCVGRLRGRYCAVIVGIVLTIAGYAGCSIVKPSQPCEVDTYAQAHPRPAPSGIPNDWDHSIPVPAHATVAEVSELQGSMRRVDFLTRGETYTRLKSFYTSELETAGYNVDQPIEEPADKTIHISFSACGRHNNVSIFPDQQKPDDFDVRVVYATNATTTRTNASSSVKKLYESCAFGDADACDQINAQPGDPTVGAAHQAIIQEELKSPEQRAKDLGPFHGM